MLNNDPFLTRGHLLGLCVCAAIVLMACNRHDTREPTIFTPDGDVEWRVQEIGDESVLASTEVTLRFHPDTQTVMGFSGCNRYASPYTLDSGVLELTQLSSTKRLCAPEVSDQESRLFNLFRQPLNPQSTPEGLRLSGTQGDLWLQSSKPDKTN